jgi:hypothetical protein
MTGIGLTATAHRAVEGAVTLVVDEELQPVSRPARIAGKQIRRARLAPIGASRKTKVSMAKLKRL